MKRILWMTTALLLILSACGPQVSPTATDAPATEPLAGIVIIDALGRSVSLPAAPQRIVITGKGLFMITDAVYMFPEAAERIAGLGSAGQGTSNFIALLDPEYAQKAVLESDAGVEQIAVLQPDLVIMKSFLAETEGQPLEVLGIPVVYVDLETPEQYPRDLAILGQVFQNEARAEAASAYFQAKMDLVGERLEADVSPLPRVLLLYYSTKGGNISFNVPPLEWMQTRIVELAGGQPVWVDANPGSGWTQVTLEQVAAWDADMIFVVAYNTDPSDAVAGFKADPNWQAIRAVQEEHLYAFPGDLYSWDQPDPRWVLGMLWLAGRMHPELFPELDMTSEAREFYSTLYGLDDAFFEQNILPTFHGDVP